MFNSNNYGRASAVGGAVGRDMVGSGSDDNNQASIRNPPDAFHNAGNSLAQNNLVGIIIQQIKMQSFGIWQRLSTCFERNRKIPELDVLLQNDGYRSQHGMRTFHRILSINGKNNAKEEAEKLNGQEEEEAYTYISMKMSIMIELCAHISIWWWHLCKTMLLSVKIDKMLAETRTSNIKFMIAKIATTTSTTDTTTATRAIDNSYNGHTNEGYLLLQNNNENINTSYNNNTYTNNNNNENCNRYMKGRQADYITHFPTLTAFHDDHDHDDDDDDEDDNDDFIVDKSNSSSSSCLHRNRQQIISINSVGNKIENCRMLPTPFATCFLLLCNLLLLLLLLLLLCFSFPPRLHLAYNNNNNITITSILTTWTTHFINILSDKRVLPSFSSSSSYSNRPSAEHECSKNQMNRKETGNSCAMKINNRRLSFNSDQQLNAITTTHQIQSFITTMPITTTFLLANTFSKNVNFKEALR